MSNKIPKKYGSTSELVPVSGLIPEARIGSGAMVVSPSGAFRMIIRVGSVNFDTKDEFTRMSLLNTFGSILSTLEPDFPIQIAIHSKVLDTEAYNDQFNSRLNNINTPDSIKKLIREHLEHFDGHVKQSTLLQKERYIIVPFKGEPGWQRKKPMDDVPMAGLFKQVFEKAEDRVVKHTPTEEDITLARQVLEVRTERLIVGLNQMNISAECLDSEEIRKLLYEYYHPDKARIQKVPGVSEGVFIPSFNPTTFTDINPQGPIGLPPMFEGDRP